MPLRMLSSLITLMLSMTLNLLPAVAQPGIEPLLAAPAALSPLAERIFHLSGANQSSDSLLGIPTSEVQRIFAPVSPWHPLPEDFVPPDLIRLGGLPRVNGQPISALVMPDLEAMVAEAHRDGVDLVVLSAYRSAADQAVIFERNVQRMLLRPDGPSSREDGERAAERFSARPGHSQHQLGTAIDFTSWEMGYSLGGRFAETETGQWLYEHAWQFGFVFPYTEASEPRSGYRNEPWHVRWVGRSLAAIMQADGYVSASYPIADDYVLAAYEIARGTSIQPMSSR